MMEEREIKSLLMHVNAARGKEMDAKRRLSRCKDQLLQLVDDIEDTQRVKLTGWYAFFTQSAINGKWKCLGCFNPDDVEGEDLPDADLIMPISDPVTVPEFSGF